MKYAGMPMGMWVLSAARADTITLVFLILPFHVLLAHR